MVKLQDNLKAAFKRLSPTELNLKTRMAVVVVALVLITTILVASASLFLVKRGMREIISQQQFTLLMRAADEIDQKFYSRQAGLESLAVNIPKAGFHDGAWLQRYLEQHANLKSHFDNLQLFDARGDVVADLNRPAKPGRTNLAHRPYIKDTLATRKSVISAPLRDEATQRAVVILTMPVIDDAGEVALILVGLIDLEQENFLGQLARMKIGHTGYFYIVTRDGTVVTHPNQSHILQNVATIEGDNPALDRAFGGFEGTTGGSSRISINGLLSFKRLKAVNWIIGAVYPQAEIFAPIAEVEDRAVIAAALLAVLVGPLAWWITRRQIAPLQQLRDHIQILAIDPRQAVLPAQFGDDEIGDLAHAFDRLMRERLSAEAELRDNRAFLESLIENLPVLVFAKSLRPENFGQIIIWNKTAEQVSGHAASDVIGKNVEGLFHPKMVAKLEELDREMLADPKVISIPEYPFRRPDGGMRFLRSISVPMFGPNGRPDFVLGIVEDITARRDTERALFESKRWLTAITDNLPALIAYVDHKERYRFCNRQYEAVFASGTNGIVGRTVSEVIGAAAYARGAARIRIALGGKRVVFERQRVDRGIERHWRVEYLPDQQQGKIVGFYVLVVDITALKVAADPVTNS